MTTNPLSRLVKTACAAIVAGGVALGGVASASGTTAHASGGASNTIVLGSPGIPPVISGLLPYIASKEGFYKKFGANVTVKSFATGTDATRAVSTGQIDASIMPPAQLMELYAQGIPLVALQGQMKPDWVIASSTGSVTSCKQISGQSVGVDAIGGIRYIALLQMLKTCGLKISDVHPIPFPGNENPQAMVAGQLQVSVLHLNELLSVEHQLHKKLTTVVSMADAVPDTMYEMYGTTKSDLAKKRKAFIEMIAAQIYTIHWMNQKQNYGKVAKLATVVGDSQAVMRQAMAQYRSMGFWTSSGPGLPRKNIDNTINAQVAAGNVPAGKAPSYGDIVDLSVYQAAAKLAKAAERK